MDGHYYEATQTLTGVYITANQPHVMLNIKVESNYFPVLV